MRNRAKDIKINSLSHPSIVFTPPSRYFPLVSGSSTNLPRSRGTETQKGTNGRCSTLVEESNGLTNYLRFLLLKFNVQNFKVKIAG